MSNIVQTVHKLNIIIHLIRQMIWIFFFHLLCLTSLYYMNIIRT